MGSCCSSTAHDRSRRVPDRPVRASVFLYIDKVDGVAVADGAHVSLRAAAVTRAGQSDAWYEVPETSVDGGQADFATGVVVLADAADDGDAVHVALQLRQAGSTLAAATVTFRSASVVETKLPLRADGDGPRAAAYDASKTLASVRFECRRYREAADGVAFDQYGFHVEHPLIPNGADTGVAPLVPYTHPGDHLDVWRDLHEEYVDEPALTQLVRECALGIPHGLRPSLWLQLARRFESMPVDEKHFRLLADAVEEQGDQLPCREAIEMDLDRTFPSHLFIATSEGKGALRSLLSKMVMHNPGVGYRGTMNFVGAFCLVVADEERAFWLLRVLCDDLFPSYFTPDLSGAHIDQRVFARLVANVLPDIGAHLERTGVQLSMVATEWFLSLFVGLLPTEHVLRFWDALFERGHSAIFNMALAVLAYHRTALLAAADFRAVFQLLKKAPQQCLDPHVLFDSLVWKVTVASICEVQEEETRAQEKLQAEEAEKQRVKAEEERIIREVKAQVAAEQAAQSDEDEDEEDETES